MANQTVQEMIQGFVEQLADRIRQDLIDHLKVSGQPVVVQVQEQPVGKPRGLAALPFAQRSEIAKRAAQTRKRRAAGRKAADTRRRNAEAQTPI